MLRDPIDDLSGTYGILVGCVERKDPAKIGPSFSKLDNFFMCESYSQRWFLAVNCNKGA